MNSKIMPNTNSKKHRAMDFLLFDFSLLLSLLSNRHRAKNSVETTVIEKRTPKDAKARKAPVNPKEAVSDAVANAKVKPCKSSKNETATTPQEQYPSSKTNSGYRK